MIRINLLPHTKRTARASSTPAGSTQTWILLYAAAMLLALAAMGALYYVYSQRLDSQLAQNRALSAEIEKTKKYSAGLEEVKAKLADSHALAGIVKKLDAGRSGPTRMMLELTKIMSTGKGPTIDPQKFEQMRRDNPHANYTAAWDVRRLWLVSFEENQRVCRIRGEGRTNEDVAEFLKRLAISELFDEITLERTEAKVDTATKLDVIAFELACKVRYEQPEEEAVVLPGQATPPPVKAGQ